MPSPSENALQRGGGTLLHAKRDRSAARPAIAVAATLSVLMLLTSSGCQALHQHMAYSPATDGWIMGWRNSVWARDAWEKHAPQCKSPHHKHFKKGFIQGYTDVANGGTGCVPPLAPREYWSWKYQSAEGQAKTAAWFDGYPLGAQAAEVDGVAHWNQIQTSYVGADLAANCKNCPKKPDSPVLLDGAIPGGPGMILPGSPTPAMPIEILPSTDKPLLPSSDHSSSVKPNAPGSLSMPATEETSMKRPVFLPKPQPEAVRPSAVATAPVPPVSRPQVTTNNAPSPFAAAQPAVAAGQPMPVRQSVSSQIAVQAPARVAALPASPATKPAAVPPVKAPSQPGYAFATSVDPMPAVASHAPAPPALRAPASPTPPAAAKPKSDIVRLGPATNVPLNPFEGLGDPSLRPMAPAPVKPQHAQLVVGDVDPAVKPAAAERPAAAVAADRPAAEASSSDTAPPRVRSKLFGRSKPEAAKPAEYSIMASDLAD